MSPEERFVSLMRQALDAYEEAHCGKKRKPRRRGLLPLETPKEVPAEVQQAVDHRLAANGYRRRG